MLFRVSIAATFVAVVGLAACDTGPTEPSPLTSPSPVLSGSTPGGSTAGASDDAQIQSLRDRLGRLEPNLEPNDVSAQSQQEIDRIRALIAALSGQLSPGDGTGGGNGGGSGGNDPPASDPVTVAILGLRGSSSFSPNPVAAGRMVTWRNDDGLTHRIVADDGSFDTGNLVAGASSVMVQPTAGGYHCSIHPTMVGSIGGGASGGGGSGGGGDDGPYVLGR